MVDKDFAPLESENTEELAEKITTALVTSDPTVLNQEALTIINQLITEQDANKQKDLTYLFTQNQNKKTMVRINKMSDLLDVITDQAMARFTAKPDQISNKEMLDALKTVSDLIERGQKQILGGEQDSPFIQINQQHNEVTMDNSTKLNRDSRERVKNAVLNLLNTVTATGTQDKAINDSEVVDND